MNFKNASAKATNSAKYAKATNSAKYASPIISDIRIFPVNNKKLNCCAMVSVTLANVFCISGIKIMDGSKGLFVAMPSAKNKKDEWHDICYPITKEFRKVMNDSILNAFESLNEDEDDDEESEDD
mgnify:CR=1 FL=1